MSLQTLIAGIVLLGGLVFFHELGHFLAAKYFNVKVLKFSLGFGPRLFGFRRGETEYQVAALPLGGFVRMAGQDPNDKLAPEDRGRGFIEQSPLRRAIIAFAGPAVNLLLPVLVFFVVNLAPQQADPPLVGLVVPGEPAERAGVQPGDRVVSVDGIPVRSFTELRELVSDRGGKSIELVVDRVGERVPLTLTPTTESETNPIETTKQGRIGIVGMRLRSYVGVAAGSRAWDAGIRTFDQIVAIGDQRFSSTRELQEALHNVPKGSAFTVEVLRPRPLPLTTASMGTVEHLVLEVPAGEKELGIVAPDLFIRTVDEHSAAWAAGLRPGDRVVTLNGEPVRSRIRFGYMLEELQNELKAGSAVLTLGIERPSASLPRGGDGAPAVGGADAQGFDGGKGAPSANGGPGDEAVAGGADAELVASVESLEITFTPPLKERRDRMLGRVQEPDFGFFFDDRVYRGERTPEDELVTYSYTAGQAIVRAVEQTVELTRVMVLGIAALFTGRVSTETIGGPIMLFQVAGEVAQSGISDFLRLFGLISINLGLVNLLPVPILDGFHIVVSGIEGISRRPVSLRFREVANYVGLALLLALMVLAFKNDIVRTFAN